MVYLHSVKNDDELTTFINSETFSLRRLVIPSMAEVRRAGGKNGRRYPRDARVSGLRSGAGTHCRLSA